MPMFNKVIYLLALTIYTALTGILLAYFEANVLFVVACLTLLPTLVFWFQEKLHSQLLPLLLALTLILTTVVEIFAYINGLWYEISPFNIRVFGLFPLEAYIAGFAHILYFIVMYEYFFDDRGNKVKTITHNTKWLSVTFGTALALALAYLYLFSGLFFSYAYALLIILGSILFLLLILFLHVSWRRIIKKALFFSIAIFPVSLIYELVALSNDLRFFANYNDYLMVFNFYNFTLPLEELLFISLIPFWLAVTYELYLDDGK
jgi:hypothetical protein